MGETRKGPRTLGQMFEASLARLGPRVAAELARPADDVAEPTCPHCGTPHRRMETSMGPKFIPLDECCSTRAREMARREKEAASSRTASRGDREECKDRALYLSRRADELEALERGLPLGERAPLPPHGGRR